MTSRPPSRRVVIPTLVALGVLIVAVAFSASVLLSPSPSRTPSPRPTLTLIAAPPATPTPTPSEAPPTPTPTPSPAVVPSKPPTIQTAVLSQRDPNGVWAVTYRYPKIATGTSPFASEIDSTIQQYVETTATQFSVGPAAAPVQGAATNTLEGSYSIALSTPGVLSIRLKEVENVGGAHPLARVATQTFDLATGQLVGLGDAFSDQTAALQILSTKSREQLRAQVGASDQLDSGTAPDQPGNFAAWAVTSTGFEITFQEYQVAPSTYGTLTVLIPWADLKAALNPNGPLAAIAA